MIPSPSPQPQVERAGVGLVFVGAGLVLALSSFLALPWVSGAGVSLTFLEIRDRLADAGADSGVSPAGRYYTSWVAFATLSLFALVAVPAALGLRSRATIVFRTLGAVAGLGAVFVHYVGVWQVFNNDVSEAEAAPFLVFLGYGLMTVGSIIGPRTTAPAASWPAPVPPAPPVPVPPAPPAPPVPPAPRLTPGPPGTWPDPLPGGPGGQP